MKTILIAVAYLVGKVAEIGAGFMSAGIGYQPKIPDELMK